jgi:RimJ/RimL family protein N-acetyltransferase
MWEGLTASRPVDREPPAPGHGPLRQGPVSPVLASTSRLSLRAREPGDSESIYRIVTDRTVRYTWRTRGVLWSPQQLNTALSRDVLVSAVATTSDNPDEIVGLGELLDPSPVDGRVHLSVVAGPSWIGSGLGAEIGLAMMAFGFHAYPIRKMYLEVVAGNDRVRPGLARLMTREATFREHLNLEGSLLDVESYAIWRDELVPLVRRLRVSVSVGGQLV